MTVTPIRRRDPYLEVCERGRSTVEAAMAAKLSAFDCKVLLAGLHATAFRSWTEDTVAAVQLASIVYQQPIDEILEWQRVEVSHALGRLARAGVMPGESRRGRGATRTIRLANNVGADTPHNEENMGADTPHSFIHNQGEGDPHSPQETWGPDPRNVGRNGPHDPINVGRRHPHTEVNYSEKDSEARARELDGPLGEKFRQLRAKAQGE